MIQNEENLQNFQTPDNFPHIPTGMTFLTNKMFLAITSQSKYVPVGFEFPRFKNEFLYYMKMDTSKKFVEKNFDNRGVRVVDFEEIDFQMGKDR